MKFTAAKEHRDYFRRNGTIEFEGLLKPDQLEDFNTAIDVGLSSRLSTTVEKLRKFNSEDIFMSSRDLWRANNAIKKTVLQSNFADFAAELIERKPLRLAYDQLFPMRVKPPFGISDEMPYSKFLSSTASLEAVSCIEGMACGLIICLSAPAVTASTASVSEIIEETEPKKVDISPQVIQIKDIFPSVPGNGLYFRTDLPINFDHFYLHPESRYFLIAYANDNAYYRLNDADPHTHVLKHLGIGFGQKLTTKYNPILTR